MGMFPVVPPGPGAAEARAAILYACSALSTSTIQYPIRNSFDSGKTPSVIGIPSLPARTILAWSGNARPSVATYVPESLSSLLKARMKAKFACRSSFDHLAYQSQSAFVPFIIRMYFMSYCSFRFWHWWVPFHGVVGSKSAVLYISQGFFGGAAI